MHKQAPVEVLQLAMSGTSNDSIIIISLSQMLSQCGYTMKGKSLSPVGKPGLIALLGFLTDPEIVFVGVNIKGDITRLLGDIDYPALADMNLLDLRSLAVQYRIIHDTSITLASLAEYQLGVHLDKPTSIRLYSSWGGDLTSGQIEYAALDVLVGLRLYENLQQRIPPQLTHYDPAHVQLGSSVHVYANNMEARMAYGTIIATSSSSVGSTSSGGIKNTFLNYTNVIKDTMVVVRVLSKDVILPSALVHTQLVPKHTGSDRVKPKAERPSLENYSFAAEDNPYIFSSTNGC